MEELAIPFYNLAMHIIADARDRASHAGGRVILLTSARPGEGKTFMARALATYLAGLSADEIALVDCNAQRPALNEVYGVRNGFGAFDCLTTRAPARAEFHQGPVPNLKILPVGQARKPGLLFKPEPVKALVDHLAQHFGVSILDGDVLGSCGSLAHLAHGVIMVVDASNTRREVVQGVMSHANLDRNKYVGAILNRRIQYIPRSFYKHL